MFLAFTAGLGTTDCVNEAVMLASPACESSEISTAFSTWGSVRTSVKGASDMIVYTYSKEVWKSRSLISDNMDS